MLSEKPRSTLSETRKVTKSTMEKKRRARINNSLKELKSILSGMVSNQGERFDKMEKADILEMTVNCVRQLQKQTHAVDPVSSTSQTDEEYKSGINTCVSEVIKVLTSHELGNTDPDVKTKLIDHLANKVCATSKPSPSIQPSKSRLHAMDTSQIQPSQNRFTELARMSDTGEDDDNELYNRNRNNTEALQQSNIFSQSTDSYFRMSSSNVNSQVSPMLVPVSSHPTSTFPTVNSTQSDLPPSSHVLSSMFETATVSSTPTQSVPSVPLTILVPANLCSTQLGTCIIPVAFTGTSPNVQQTSTLDNNNSMPLTGSSMNIIPPPLVNISPNLISPMAPAVQTYILPTNTVPMKPSETTVTSKHSVAKPVLQSDHTAFKPVVVRTGQSCEITKTLSDSPKSQEAFQNCDPINIFNPNCSKDANYQAKRINLVEDDGESRTHALLTNDHVLQAKKRSDTLVGTDMRSNVRVSYPTNGHSSMPKGAIVNGRLLDALPENGNNCDTMWRPW